MKQTQILLLFLLITTSLSVHSQTIYWDGGGGDNLWITAANWTLDILPSNTDEVWIDAGANVVIPSGFEARVSHVRINDATLTIAPTALLEVKYHTYPFGIAINANATLTNNGTIEASSNFFYGILMNYSSSELYNNGVIHINNTTTSGMLANGLIRNNGHLNIGPNVAEHGILMNTTALFQNTANGRINILGVGNGNSGIKLASSQNASGLENEGIICINDVSGNGGENIDSNINYSGNGEVNTSGCVATVPATIPTLSQWGLINLALLLMICGTLVLIQEGRAMDVH